MRMLSARDIVLAWEAGQGKHPVDRALLLLALALPEIAPATLNAWTVGQRNAQLLALRQQTLGAVMPCFVHCPQCDELLEFTLDSEALLRLVPEDADPADQMHTLTLDTCTVYFRLPDSRDLAAVASSADADEARQILMARLIGEARDGDRALAVADLPEAVMPALAEAIAERDPLAGPEFTLNCPACQHSWRAVFDIVSFFWTEIEAQAKRLLGEVHTLARIYGWHEAEILALSSARRQFYLEMIS
jgi:hypothetical protein